MHDIFLSYASEDRARASQLAEALGKQGWEVWWDRTILPGKTFDRVIESELNAATCVIVLWSKTSVESRWVRAEAGDALDKGRLIPVLLEDLKIPLVFRQIQAASLLDWGGDTEHAGFIQLTRAITTFVSPTLTSDTSTDVGDTTSKPETAAPEPAPRQLGALRESSHTLGQSKSGSRFSALFWPTATISALLIAGLSVYLYWQKPTVTETPVTAETPMDRVIQAARSDRGIEIQTTVRPVDPGNPKVDRAIRQDNDQEPAGQAKIAPRESEPATAPDPVRKIMPPKPTPSKPEQPKAVEPKIAQPAPAPVIKQNPPQVKTRVTRPRPAAPQSEAPAPTIAKATATTTAVPEAPLAPLKVLMIVWGTPNDNGSASPSQTRDFSSSLAQLMTGIVEESIRHPIAFDYRYINDTEHHSLIRDNRKFKQSSAMCSEMNVDLLIFGLVEGSEFDSQIGYVPSREPFFMAFNCKSAQGVAKRFKVAEANEDSFPYEIALTRAFRTFSNQQLITVGGS